MTKPILFAWSSGKDSAMALYEIFKRKDIEVRALLTTLTEGFARVSMHGVREELLDAQAAALGLPLVKVRIPQNCANTEYEARMQATLEQFVAQGVKTVAFGDIFLEDLREYREKQLARIDMTALFPIWKRDTRELAKQVIQSGIKAILTCVDGNALDGAFAGRAYDESLLSDLPAGVDPCGENGEFHSFVYDAPMFCQPIDCQRGETVLREQRFWFCDLLVEPKKAKTP